MSTATSLGQPAPARRSPWLALCTPRWAVFFAVLVGYAVLTAGVMFRTPVLTLDDTLYGLHLHVRHPALEPLAHVLELLGQRGPATLLALPYFFWVAYRSRSSRPLVMLGIALIVLNLSVGVVKVLCGRLSPQQSRFVEMVSVGGNIYPSGHVANAVVLYGLIAWITPRHRRLVILAGVAATLIVSFFTVFLNTHWFSDVAGGWFAGALVLLLLPTLLPWTQRRTDAVVRRLSARRSASRVDLHGRNARRDGGQVLQPHQLR